jgi:hypothetical protein
MKRTFRLGRIASRLGAIAPGELKHHESGSIPATPLSNRVHG